MENHGMTKINIITGSIGSGKSTVAQILRDKNFIVYDTDQMVHDLYEKPRMIEKIRKEFGEQVINKNQIDRKALGEIVFNSKEKMRTLENIVHPDIIDMLESVIRDFSGDLLFVEMPQFFEIEEKIRQSLPIGEVWLVILDQDTQIQRVMERDHMNYHEAKKRLKSQWPNERKVHHSDQLLYNNGSINDLEKTIGNILNGEKYESD
ncbi:MAG: dephospho-CoA kinase [Tissierellia bacterium]|nr:dephospho-CoA kinase [Tissierellia bacterium]